MITFEEYQAINAINASSIKAGRISMKHMRAEMTKDAPKDSPSLRWGRLVHSAILEPDLFFRRLAIYDGVRRGKEWDKFEADHDPAFIVKPDEHAELFALSNAVHANAEAHRLITGSIHEMTVLWNREQDGIGKCKARLDGWMEGEGLIVELKTTTRITPAQFARQFLAYGYDLQAGWYADGVEMITNKKPAVVLVVIEAEPPFDVFTAPVPRLAIEQGQKQAREIARKYRDCEAAGQFPGVLDGRAALDELPLPEWYGADLVSSAFAEMAASEL